MVFPRFIRHAVANEPIPVYGDGTQTRCFCDVRDTVAALDKLTGSPESYGQIVNVGSDREISILDLANLIKSRAGSSSPIKFVPHKEAYGEDFEETVRRRPCLKKFLRLTGFKHQWTLERTMDDLIARERTNQASPKGR